jgi:two-component system, NtrC family, response regulator HydG
MHDSEGLPGSALAAGQASGQGNLVGRPLNEVERYYIAQALQLTNGNREEAARMLGIGERTLYRIIQDWKFQDKIRQALAEANGNTQQAAHHLSMNESSLQRKMKKWGMAN